MARSWRVDDSPRPPLAGVPAAAAEPQRPSRRRGVIAAGAAAVVLAAVGGAGYLLGGERGAGPTVRPPAAAVSPRATGPRPAASPPAAYARPGAGLTAAPTGIRWELYQGVELPYSPTAGPRQVRGAVASGFARSPLGALLAAVQTATRYYVSPTPGWRQETARMVLPGPGRDYFERVRSTMDDAAPVDGYTQLAAFRYVTYSPDQAVVQTVDRLGQVQQVSTLTVRWVRGDWRTVLQPNGAVSPAIVPVADLTGFVPWSAGI